MTYTANINTPSPAIGAILTGEMFDAKIMNAHGWSDIASMHDLNAPEAGYCHIPDYNGYEQAKDRANLLFSLMQEHIEMLFSPENLNFSL